MNNFKCYNVRAGVAVIGTKGDMGILIGDLLWDGGQEKSARESRPSGVGVIWEVSRCDFLLLPTLIKLPSNGEARRHLQGLGRKKGKEGWKGGREGW